jgi:Na+-translocating ferredoxin:NAD+ oxidoreductase RnfG subunit
MKRYALCWALGLIGIFPGVAQTQVRLTQEDALRLAFPEPASVERRTAFLNESDVARASELAGSGVEVDQRVVTYYVGSNGDGPLGVAYFDAHRVRTLPEVLMIVVTPDSKVERIEILKFMEPPDYIVPESWLDQFDGRQLSDELEVKGSIVNMTGATLTSRAVTSAARRVLALHQVIEPLAIPAGGSR